MTRMEATPDTWLVGKHLGQQKVTPVAEWWIDDHGANSLTRTMPGEDAILVKGTELDAAKVAAMRELVEMAERATNAAQLEVVERAADWVMNWEPRRV
ncbi:hypothetical protein [Streptomyces turgidiscabies]|uniref:hypothetical protein n=1 Tax=Streptomyces turgidiscabies TaxID=85558 RepID=UPI0038F7971C